MFDRPKPQWAVVPVEEEEEEEEGEEEGEEEEEEEGVSNEGALSPKTLPSISWKM